MLHNLKSCYGYGFRFGKIATPLLPTKLEKRRALHASTCPVWMGPLELFVWRQGLRDGVGVLSLFSILRVLGW